MTFILAPKPNGYYAECAPTRNEPSIEQDIDFLLDADAHAPLGTYNLRSEVLVVRATEDQEGGLE